MRRFNFQFTLIFVLLFLYFLKVQAGIPVSPPSHNKLKKSPISREKKLILLNNWFKLYHEMDMNWQLRSPSGGLPRHIRTLKLGSKYSPKNNRNLVETKKMFKTYQFATIENFGLTIRTHKERGIVYIILNFGIRGEQFMLKMKEYLKLRFGKYLISETKDRLFFSQAATHMATSSGLAMTYVKHAVGIHVMELSRDVLKLP